MYWSKDAWVYYSHMVPVPKKTVKVGMILFLFRAIQFKPEARYFISILQLLFKNKNVFKKIK